MSYNVALCYPPSIAVTVMPPLGIGYLAAVAEKKGYPTDIYDLSRRHLSLRGFRERLQKGSYRVIGVSVSTPNCQNALQLIRIIREAAPESTIVIGGAHPSAFLKRSLEDFKPDYLIQKESEVSFPLFLDSIAKGNDPAGEVEGVFALRNGDLAGQPSTHYIENLDSLPWPAWDKLEPHRYPPTPHQLFVKRFPVSPIITTRGCPMECTFCASSYLFGHKVRTRNAKDIVEELRFLKGKFGIREVHFEDDNLTLIQEHAVTLFEEIIRADLGLLFKCPNGLMTETLNDQIFSLMTRAGTYQISLGIETTSPESQNKEKKYLPYKKVEETVALAKKNGLDVQGLFVVGLPYEKNEHIRQTVRDSIRMGLDLAHFGVFIPLPGTPQEEMLASCDIETLNFFTPHIEYDHTDAKTIKALQRWAILRFYLRPKPIWKLLTLFKLRQFFGVLNVIRRYLLGF